MREPAAKSYLLDSWERLRSNPAAVFSLATLSFLFLMAAIGPFFTPYSFSEIHLELKNTAPCAKKV